MKRPKIKRNRSPHGAVISSAEFPIDAFLNDCPLPPKYKHLEPAIRGPIGQTLMTSLTTCLEEGFTFAQLEDVARQVVDFFSHEHHRCTACHNWTDDFAAGAVIIDGGFKITVVCKPCGRLVAAGQETNAMARNVSGFLFGGDA